MEAVNAYESTLALGDREMLKRAYHAIRIEYPAQNHGAVAATEPPRPPQAAQGRKRFYGGNWQHGSRW